LLDFGEGFGAGVEDVEDMAASVWGFFVGTVRGDHSREGVGVGIERKASADANAKARATAGPSVPLKNASLRMTELWFGGAKSKRKRKSNSNSKNNRRSFGSAEERSTQDDRAGVQDDRVVARKMRFGFC